MAGLPGVMSYSTTDTTIQNVETVLISKAVDLRSDRDYFVFWGASVSPSANSVNAQARLRDNTNGIDYPTYTRRIRTANGSTQLRGLAKVRLNSQASAVALQVIGSCNSATNITFRSQGIAVIERGSLDQYTYVAGQTSTQSTSLVDVASITVPEGGGGNWLVFACGNARSNAVQDIYCELHDGTNSYGSPDTGGAWDVQASVSYSWSAQTVLTFSGSKTFKVRMLSLAGASAVSLNDVVLVAIQLGADYGFNEDLTKTTSNSTSYAAKATKAYTATAGDVLVLGTVVTDNTAGGVNTNFAGLTAGGSSVGDDSSYTPATAQMDSCHQFLFGETVSAGSRTYTVQCKSAGSSTLGRQKGSIFVVNLNALTALDTNTEGNFVTSPGFWYKGREHLRSPTRRIVKDVI